MDPDPPFTGLPSKAYRSTSGAHGEIWLVDSNGAYELHFELIAAPVGAQAAEPTDDDPIGEGGFITPPTPNKPPWGLLLSRPKWLESIREVVSSGSLCDRVRHPDALVLKRLQAVPQHGPVMFREYRLLDVHQVIRRDPENVRWLPSDGFCRVPHRLEIPGRPRSSLSSRMCAASSSGVWPRLHIAHRSLYADSTSSRNLR